MADILIAGGGIAGSALAILLGRQGFSVDLFERGVFPREKPCGEGLMPSGVAALERLGVLAAAGGTPFVGVRYHFGHRVAEGRFPGMDGRKVFGLGQRRRHLDEILFRAAEHTPGVSARTGALVEAPIMKNGRVVGLRVAGAPHYARLVVAADGSHSRLRRRLGLDAPVRRRRIGVRSHFRLPEGREWGEWVEVFVGGDHELYVTPLPAREVLVAGLTDGPLGGESMGKVFDYWWRSHSSLAARLEGAEQVSELAGMSPLASRARRGFVPGAVLLGDAAGFIDPITGGGMAQALETAELLAKFLEQHPRDDDKWLKRFDGERNAVLRDYRVLTRLVLWLADHPRLAERALAILSDAPRLFSHLIGVAGGVRTLLPPLGAR